MREKFADSFADSLASHLDLSLSLVIDDFIDLKEPTGVSQRTYICKDIVVVLKSELDKEQRNGVQYWKRGTQQQNSFTEIVNKGS